jgi:glycosyl transferase family 25
MDPQKIRCYLINLDRSVDRLAVMTKRLAKTGLPWQRVPAVEGRELDIESDRRVDISGYQARHGKRINPAEVGCYLSHVVALKEFLLRPDLQWAVILEDDVDFAGDFSETIAALLAHPEEWDMVKLSGFHSGTPKRTVKLSGKRSLAIMWSRMTGSAAYVVNRKAAESYISHLLPMSVPYDHVFDQGWKFDLKIRMVSPLPTELDPELPSTIGYGPSDQRRLPFVRRFSCFAYRLRTEIRRVSHAALQTALIFVGR